MKRSRPPDVCGLRKPPRSAGDGGALYAGPDVRRVIATQVPQRTGDMGDTRRPDAPPRAPPR